MRNSIRMQRLITRLGYDQEVFDRWNTYHYFFAGIYPGPALCILKKDQYPPSILISHTPFEQKELTYEEAKYLMTGAKTKEEFETRLLAFIAIRQATDE